MATASLESNENLVKIEAAEDSEEEEELESLSCNECGVNFLSAFYLKKHLLFHVRQPSIRLEKLSQLPPIKLTFKSTSENNFEVVLSPTTASSLYSPKSLSGDKSSITDPLEGESHNLAEFEESADESHHDSGVGSIEGVSSIDGMDFANFDDHTGPIITEITDEEIASGSSIISNKSNDQSSTSSDFNNIPGAEPTPPPEPSPEYPKIRIKTGLLKESLTITEITDDNPNGGYDKPETISLSDIVELGNSSLDSSIWGAQSLEDPLKLPDSASKDDNNIISNLFSNNDRAKDLGFTTSDSEFISLDRLDDRNRGALQVYSSNSSTSSYNTGPLDSLAGLPMQQLAEQVSRLQPSGNGMHQQNVLINIQQFPQAPPQTQPQHNYQPPPMYHPQHPGVPPQHPGVPPQQPPMYQPYQYQPPNPMFYPPAPGYPPHMPPPRPQMPPHPQQQMGQPMPAMQQPPQYRQPQMTPPRPRQPTQQGQRPQMAPRQPMGPRQPMAPRQPMQARQRAPVARPRGPVPMHQMRAPRPRMGAPQQQQQPQQQNGQQQNGQQAPKVVKRTPEQIQALQAKRKRMDVLVPDKHDDADCQVIAIQQKNSGMPQIQSVQGSAPENNSNNNINSNSSGSSNSNGNGSSGDNSVMHLSDSITLSVRNPPPRTESPKKSDAKQVANILATRGITVTATGKTKEKEGSSSPKTPPPVAINLNSAVSIIPNAANTKPASKPASEEAKLTTVDLTDDTNAEPPPPPPPKPAPAKNNNNLRSLPFRCDLCPAQYPNSVGLMKHRQHFHKASGACDFGVPLINLKQPGILNRLSNIGIYNYIPISASAEGTFALPVINVNTLNKNNNLGAIGASSVLTLGPIRSIARTTSNTNNGNSNNSNNNTNVGTNKPN